MKKYIFITIIAGLLPIAMQAQSDDLYFTPKKNSGEQNVRQPVYERNGYAGYHSGSDRDVDEYNRHPGNSYYEMIDVDSVGNDIIEFHPGSEDSDSVCSQYDGDGENEYEYSRRMKRFDGYQWIDPWYPGYYTPYYYNPYLWSRWGWYDYWYGYSGYGYPYYYGWYRPYYGWYDPWYYGGWSGYGYGYYPW